MNACVFGKKMKMEYEPLTSKQIKLKLMSYFRYKRQYELVCSECDQMDFFAVKFSSMKVVDMIECEVKVSKSDLLQDMKKHKHLNGVNHSFYFAIEEHLLKPAMDICQGQFCDYGIILVKPSQHPLIVKRAAKKIPQDINQMISMAISRMSSELITRTQQLEAKL